MKAINYYTTGKMNVNMEEPPKQNIVWMQKKSHYAKVYIMFEGKQTNVIQFKNICYKVCRIMV